ncbi:MAG: glycosyltransferase family 9 protein [Chloroflexota bacterium]
MNDQFTFYREDCQFFRGDVPCAPHKQRGYKCADCPVYTPERGKILIIKLGAIGDVIRTTPLLERIWKEYEGYSIWWLTQSPEVLPKKVNKILPFNLESILTIEQTEFDRVINLDKDPHACALASRIKTSELTGFTFKNGRPAPANALADHKFVTGVFDDVNKANRKNYMEEIFEICGWQFQGEEYILEKNATIEWNIDSGGKPIVGLNTGCGARWVSRLWKEQNWVELIKRLQSAGYFPLLLGGAQEHEVNSRLAETTGAAYLGHYKLNEFISLVDECDIIVSAVTMGMHLAIGLKKPLILMNNIFNKYEFELYGRGEIVEPRKECKCFFSPRCINEEYFCMDHLGVDQIFDAIERQKK